MAAEYQVVIVTGASSGIGWKVAKVLAAEGSKVGLIARRQDRLDALVAEIEQAGGSAVAAAADVSDREQTLAAIGTLRERLGPIDLLLANAGVGRADPKELVGAADVERMIRVNFLGVVYAIEAVLPEMLTRGRGHIAGVSSLAAYKGLPGTFGYCATKAALNIFLEGLRISLRGRGVFVTTICPGYVRTPMTVDNQWMPWLLEADDAARRIVRALHRKSKVYNFPWQPTLLVKLTRWLPDWLLARTLKP